jgi:glutamate-1-semialdehyde 2,1-aminomutase
MSNKSFELFSEAKKFIPGGVNSPVRAFKSVGLNPLFISKAKGSKIYDIENNEYIDYVGSWGPMILGHSNPVIINALKEQLEFGTSFGAPTAKEIELAKLINESVPSIEKIRLVNSGTEATMSAIRIARGYTGKDKIIKFEGCYHGHVDALLVKAGSGALTFGTPDSPGIPGDFAKLTLIAEFNNIDSVKNLISENKNEIAAVILEPVPGNMGVVEPDMNFLKELREITANEGIVLIFDEVMSGFRVSIGGAQKLYNIVPDLTTLGKIIGGGLPVGAFGGKREIMDCVAPEGKVYQAGTLSGNPLAVTAGIETLKLLKNNKLYRKLDELSEYLTDGMKNIIKHSPLPHCFKRVGSMFCLFFTNNNVKNFKDAVSSDTKLFAKYFSLMLRENIYIAPSQYEAGFLSTAHTKEDLDKTLEAFEKAIKNLTKEG